MPNAAAGWMQKYYFSVISGLVLFLSVWGFSDNLFWKVDQPSNSDPKFVAHGLFCLAWMVAFFAQSTLIRKGDVQAHRKVGTWGFLAALGVAISTIYIFVVVWRGWDQMAIYIKANRILLPSYAVLLMLAYRYRFRPDWHKRLACIATLFMLEPILSRAFDPINPWLLGYTDEQVDGWWWIFFLVTWNGLILSLFAYDWSTLRRIHPVTIAGVAWFYAVWGVLALV